MPDLKTSNQDLNAQLKTLTNRGYLLLSLLFFFGVLALSIWGIVPKFNSISAQKDKISQAEASLQNVQDKLTKINNMVDDPEFAQAELVEQVLYENNPFLEVLYALTQVSAANNITFDRFEYSPGLIATPSASQFSGGNALTAAARSVNAQQNQGFTIFIEAGGTYSDLANFLHQLENTAPLSSVAYVEINNSLLGYASAQIEILAHYYQPNIAAQLDEALPVLSEAEKQTLAKLSSFTIPNLDDMNQAELIGGKTDIFSGITAQEIIDDLNTESETTTEQDETNATDTNQATNEVNSLNI